MMELLFLLLPLAAAGGWYSGRRQGPSRRQGCDLDQAYYQGLNLLLNEQPDKAVDHFIEMLEVNSETVETHLALGGLFRRRGEVDRAIRIHQNLIARPSLSREQRHQALLELGRDYLKAGLYDRSIGLFEELLEQRLYQLEALRHLHQIYQRVRDWNKALSTAIRLESLGEPSLKRERAHYQCELAQEALSANDEHQAETLLKKALATDAQCVRAAILLGDLARRRGNFAEAIRRYSAVEGQDAAFIGEVMLPLAECLRATGQEPVLREVLQRAVDRAGNLVALSLLVKEVARSEGNGAARALVQRQLQGHPSLEALLQLLRLGPDEEGDDPLLAQVEAVLGQMVGNLFPYQCGHCGFTGRKLYWHCPGCGGWGVMKPKAAGGLNSPSTLLAD